MRNNNTEIKLSTIPSICVNSLVNKLSNAYISLIKNNIELSKMASVMLWGPPGIGKSQAVRQIAKEINNITKKKVNVTDVRLLLFNPIDLRGIPTSNADKTLAVWLKPKIFDMDTSKNVINILFLDEISAAPASVQAAAYQITLDRVVGEHKLPDNCIVIAAGNRVTDKSVVYNMPKALANRLLHLEVEGNFDSWKDWAIKNGINPKVTAFLSFKRDYLMQFENITTDDLAFPTPRSWEMVSNILNNVDDDLDNTYSLVAGLIGNGAANEFRTFDKVFKHLPNIEDIFKGKSPSIPKSTDVIYALISSMVSYAKEHKNDLNKIANSISYANKLPVDFATVLFKDYLSIEKDYRLKLMRIPEFSRWLNTKGSLLNAIN